MTAVDTAGAVQCALSELVATADRRTLAAVVTHLSGDVGAVPDLSDRAAIDQRALEILPPFVAGEVVPPLPDDELLQAAMDLAVGAPVPAEYRQLVREQTGIGPIAQQPALPDNRGFSVAIIGAGASGVVVARTLKERGLANFDIYEANPSPGGTWWANTYPGCRVDTPSLLYSYSFNPDPGWPEHFSPQPALLSYFRGVVHQSGLEDRLHLCTEVKSLRWDADEAVWHIALRAADGSETSTTANVVVAATGLLRVPRMPEINGMDDFAGPSWHSAEWNHDVDLTGRRVAVIGTGASGQQIVPALAQTAGHVTVFQRSPQWLMPHKKYGKSFTGLEKQLYDRIPMYREWNRFAESWRFGDGTTPIVKIDPDWPHEGSVNKLNEQLRTQLIEYIDSQVGHRPDLVDAVIPTYPPFAKRMLIDNGWYQALLRDNVELETGRIDRITPTGVATAIRNVDVDVIIYATGFYADRFLHPMQITGAGGADVSARMAARPEAYLGVAVEDCPNFFLTPGPNAVLAHAGNGMFFAESHARYIAECVNQMLIRRARTMSVKPAAVRTYVADTMAQLETFVQSRLDVDNWFRGDRDRIVTIAAKTVLEFWNDYRAVDEAAYDFTVSK